MNKSRRFLRVLGIFSFSIGALLGMAFFISATWADVESILYGFVKFTNHSTSAMRCPAFVTGDETGVVSVRIRNTTGRVWRPTLRVVTSNRGLMTPRIERLSFEAGESRRVQWELAPENVVLGRFIFVKMYLYAAYPLPDREQSCGILVLDLPGLTGSQVTLAAIVTSLALMLAGDWLWLAANRPLKKRTLDVMRAMIVLTAAVAGGILSVLLASWVMGILLGVIAILLVGVMLGSAVQSSSAD